MVFKQRPDIGYTENSSGTTCRISLTISSGIMDNLAKKETIIIGPPVRRARHDITLPSHIKTNVITLGNTFQPSYLTEVQIRLVSGYLRLRMPEKKRCNTN